MFFDVDPARHGRVIGTKNIEENEKVLRGILITIKKLVTNITNAKDLISMVNETFKAKGIPKSNDIVDEEAAYEITRINGSYILTISPENLGISPITFIMPVGATSFQAEDNSFSTSSPTSSVRFLFQGYSSDNVPVNNITKGPSCLREINYPDNVYYIGDILYGERHGDGILYNENAEIIFSGTWKENIPMRGQLFFGRVSEASYYTKYGLGNYQFAKGFFNGTFGKDSITNQIYLDTGKIEFENDVKIISYEGDFKKNQFSECAVYKIIYNKTHNFFDDLSKQNENLIYSLESYFRYVESSEYQGAINKDNLNSPLRHGEGILTGRSYFSLNGKTNGISGFSFVYRGRFNKNKAWEFGEIIESDGSFYIGEFDNGQAKGIGLFYDRKKMFVVEPMCVLLTSRSKFNKEQLITSFSKFCTKIGSSVIHRIIDYISQESFMDFFFNSNTFSHQGSDILKHESVLHYINSVIDIYKSSAQAIGRKEWMSFHSNVPKIKNREGLKVQINKEYVIIPKITLNGLDCNIFLRYPESNGNSPISSNVIEDTSKCIILFSWGKYKGKYKSSLIQPRPGLRIDYNSPLISYMGEIKNHMFNGYGEITLECSKEDEYRYPTMPATYRDFLALPINSDYDSGCGSDFYLGEFQNNLAHGFGVFYRNGVFFIGTFKNGVFQCPVLSNFDQAVRSEVYFVISNSEINANQITDKIQQISKMSIDYDLGKYLLNEDFIAFFRRITNKFYKLADSDLFKLYSYNLVELLGYAIKFYKVYVNISSLDDKENDQKVWMMLNQLMMNNKSICYDDLLITIFNQIIKLELSKTSMMVVCFLMYKSIFKTPGVVSKMKDENKEPIFLEYEYIYDLFFREILDYDTPNNFINKVKSVSSDLNHDTLVSKKNTQFFEYLLDADDLKLKELFYTIKYTQFIKKIKYNSLQSRHQSLKVNINNAHTNTACRSKIRGIFNRNVVISNGYIEISEASVRFKSNSVFNLECINQNNAHTRASVTNGSTVAKYRKDYALRSLIFQVEKIYNCTFSNSDLILESSTTMLDCTFSNSNVISLYVDLCNLIDAIITGNLYLLSLFATNKTINISNSNLKSTTIVLGVVPERSICAPEIFLTINNSTIETVEVQLSNNIGDRIIVETFASDGWAMPNELYDADTQWTLQKLLPDKRVLVDVEESGWSDTPKHVYLHKIKTTIHDVEFLNFNNDFRECICGDSKSLEMWSVFFKSDDKRIEICQLKDENKSLFVSQFIDPTNLSKFLELGYHDKLISLMPYSYYPKEVEKRLITYILQIDVKIEMRHWIKILAYLNIREWDKAQLNELAQKIELMGVDLHFLDKSITERYFANLEVITNKFVDVLMDENNYLKLIKIILIINMDNPKFNIEDVRNRIYGYNKEAIKILKTFIGDGFIIGNLSILRTNLNYCNIKKQELNANNYAKVAFNKRIAQFEDMFVEVIDNDTLLVYLPCKEQEDDTMNIYKHFKYEANQSGLYLFTKKLNSATEDFKSAPHFVDFEKLLFNSKDFSSKNLEDLEVIISLKSSNICSIIELSSSKNIKFDNPLLNIIELFNQSDKVESNIRNYLEYMLTYKTTTPPKDILESNLFTASIDQYDNVISSKIFSLSLDQSTNTHNINYVTLFKNWKINIHDEDRFYKLLEIAYFGLKLCDKYHFGVEEFSLGHTFFACAEILKYSLSHFIISQKEVQSMLNYKFDNIGQYCVINMLDKLSKDIDQILKSKCRPTFLGLN